MGVFDTLTALGKLVLSEQPFWAVIIVLVTIWLGKTILFVITQEYIRRGWTRMETEARKLRNHVHHPRDVPLAPSVETSPNPDRTSDQDRGAEVFTDIVNTAILLIVILCGFILFLLRQLFKHRR